MDRWLAVSDGANAALHALAYAVSRGNPVSARAAADALGVSPSYLAKLIRTLSKAGLVEAHRGAAGGFAFKGDAKKLSCLDVIVAVDGPIPKRHCLFAASVCRRGSCALKTLCGEISVKAVKVLGSTTIADVARSFE
jgi:Rrf2 family protein